jgi:hypothetical protein
LIGGFDDIFKTNITRLNLTILIFIVNVKVKGIITIKGLTSFYAMQIKILKPIFYLDKVFKVGKEIEIKDDGKGNPLESFWRNRLKDAKLDNCIEVVNKSYNKSKNKKEDKE